MIFNNQKANRKKNSVSDHTCVTWFCLLPSDDFSAFLLFPDPDWPDRNLTVNLVSKTSALSTTFQASLGLSEASVADLGTHLAADISSFSVDLK